MESELRGIGHKGEGLEVRKALGMHMRLLVEEGRGGLVGEGVGRFCKEYGVSEDDLAGYVELMRRGVGDLMEQGARLGVMTLMELAGGAKAARLRAKCAVELLNRAGYVKPEYGAKVSIEARGAGEVVKHLLPEVDREKVIKFLRDSVPRDAVPAKVEGSG